MNELTNKDSFKNRIKNKLDDSPVYRNEEELWSKIIRDIEEDEAKEKTIVRKIHPILWWSVAASLMIGILISILYRKENPPAASFLVNDSKVSNTPVAVDSIVKSEPKTEQTPKEEKAVPKTIAKKDNIAAEEASAMIASKEEVLEHILPDGSQLTLNKLSSVKLNGNFRNERTLSMQGEVYFEIEPDKSRPFTIYFDQHHLLVVGTKFNIRSLKEESFKEIAVTEGIVKVFPKNKKQGIELRAGDRLKLNDNGETELAKTNANNFIFWKLGILDFNNSTMEEVSELMSRHYNKKITIDKALSTCTFTGDFTQLSLDEAIHILTITTSYKVEKRKHEIYISGEGCK
jgi:hypothetical protein